MKKYRWLFVILGVAVLGMTLIFGAAFGAGITYFLLQAEPVQASLGSPAAVKTDEGVLISSVKPDSAAAEAGLVRGDIILQINGESVNNLSELKAVLAELKPGDTVEMAVLHGDETRSLQLELDDIKGFAYLGVELCNPFLGAKNIPGRPMGDFFMEAIAAGAEITEVVLGSPAEAAGLQVGDLILRVDEKKVGPRADLADLIQQLEPGETVSLIVSSKVDDDPREIAVILGQNPDDPETAYLGVAYQMGVRRGYRSGDLHLEELFPNGEIPEGLEEGMPRFFFHHGDEFDGELPEGWENGGQFFFHGGEGMPDLFDLGELPDGVDGAVIISEVLEDTPAADAGLQENDLILAVDDDSVTDVDVFINALKSHKPGDEVVLTVFRAGEEFKVTVTLAEHPDDPESGYLGVMAGSLSLQLPEGFEQDFEFELPGLPGGDA
jgi:S1-C subfamily serine protease